MTNGQGVGWLDQGGRAGAEKITANVKISCCSAFFSWLRGLEALTSTDLGRSNPTCRPATAVANGMTAGNVKGDHCACMQQEHDCFISLV